MTKFDTVIVDPDSATRIRLKQVTSAVPQFGKTYIAVSPNEAISYFKMQGQIDVCFVSSAFPQATIDEIIKIGKESRASQDAAFISVLKGHVQDKETLANSVIGGFDGLLFEPYSVDQLVDITRVAAKVRKERSDAREIVALKMLVSGYMTTIDQMAALGAQQLNTSALMQKFAESCNSLKKLNTESFRNYEGVAPELFMEARIPDKLFNKPLYRGASKRVGSKLKTALQGELDKLAK